MASDVTAFTKDQRTFLVLFFLNSLMTFLLFNMAGPLYPPEATSKGLDASKFGAIMSLTCGAMIIVSFFITKMEKIGLMFSYVACSFVSGASTILIGLVHYIDSYWAFVLVSIMGFFVSGIAMTVRISSSYMLCLSVFPTRTAIAIGVIEGGFLAASSLGPLVCELIFTYAGFTGTYVIFGIVQFGIGLLTLFTLPPVPTSSTHFPSFKEMMLGYFEIAKFPSIIMYAIILVLLEMGSDFISTILEPGLRPFNLTRIGVGFMFICVGLPQLLVPFWGLVVDKLKRPELLLVSSLLVIFAATFILRGSIDGNYNGTVTGLLIIGFGQGIMDISAVFNFIQEVKEKRQQEAVAVNFSFISVIYSFTTGVGGVIGPCIAGILFDNYEFRNAIMFLALTHGTMGVVLIMHMVRKKCKPRSILSQNTEYEALLD